ncbi:hypothetical protein N7466_002312 [Penicillium verhagenii]|uniref:uncharacterized protein n=1 Tax=Penicillium verhagenii TaxID=1562060 RepID=UPI002545A2CF|nr:uncharacterized protein N7466_002312 [Penicillium verhagenii]KAJ5939178.1 hypothetical protein N7466_002312 [Penicillium verhagenii]
MPPKRPSDSSAPAAKRQAKKPKSDAVTNAEAIPLFGPRACSLSRYSNVSVTRNSHVMYLKSTLDPEKAYAFQCLCLAQFREVVTSISDEYDDEDDDEWSGEDDKDDGNEENEDSSNKKQENAKGGEKPKIPKCDRGETCLCGKPAAEHPEHPWITSFAGFQKAGDMNCQASVRVPDFFNMYTYNDHAGYGVMEVVQNLILDFKAARELPMTWPTTWKEMWALCEGFAIFCMKGNVDCFMTVDDGEGVEALCKLASQMLLEMLAILEKCNLLGPESEVKNLGLIMALFLRFGKELEFDDFAVDIFAFAKKHSIKLVGLSEKHFDELQHEYEGNDGNLSDEREKPKSFDDAFASYKKSEGTIGGDKLDVTSWTTAERKEHSFDKKDPFDAKSKAAIKAGGVLSFS